MTSKNDLDNNKNNKKFEITRILPRLGHAAKMSEGGDQIHNSDLSFRSPLKNLLEGRLCRSREKESSHIGSMRDEFSQIHISHFKMCKQPGTSATAKDTAKSTQHKF